MQLGLNAKRATAGKVNSNVYIVFIVIQGLGPFVAFLLPAPNKVQRTDGLPVRLAVTTGLVHEIKAAGRLFFTKRVSLLSLLRFTTEATSPVSVFHPAAPAVSLSPNFADPSHTAVPPHCSSHHSSSLPRELHQHLHGPRMSLMPL